AQALEDGRVVMWFDGRMEYGPRALGRRSVLARPDRADVRDRLNLALKRRVWYQPFCPSMLESDASRLLSDWTGDRNRAMTMAYEVAPCFRGRLAGVVSINGTCRPQVIDDDARGAFADVLREARALGHRRRPQHQLQHPRGADGLLARRCRGRVPARRCRRAGDRPVLRRASRRPRRFCAHARTARALIAAQASPASPRAWLAAG